MKATLEEMGSRECFYCVVSRALEMACDSPKYSECLVAPAPFPSPSTDSAACMRGRALPRGCAAAVFLPVARGGSVCPEDELQRRELTRRGRNRRS